MPDKTQKPDMFAASQDEKKGGRDRKLNPLSQVLSCQRRSTAALLPIGVKWCQISLADQFPSSRPEHENIDSGPPRQVEWPVRDN
jgi:hypothetical protein